MMRRVTRQCEKPRAMLDRAPRTPLTKVTRSLARVAASADHLPHCINNPFHHRKHSYKRSLKIRRNRSTSSPNQISRSRIPSTPVHDDIPSSPHRRDTERSHTEQFHQTALNFLYSYYGFLTYQDELREKFQRQT